MPDRADLIRLRKVPADLDGKPNPLALLNAAGPCLLNGNLVTTGEDYDAWRYTLEKTVRKELERSWRVFTRDPAASCAPGETGKKSCTAVPCPGSLETSMKPWWLCTMPWTTARND